MKIYLLMPTIGRVDEIQDFILSINNKDVPTQLLIADQNELGFLDPCVLKKNNNLEIVYYHSQQKGLSFNRNLLINKLDDDEGIIAFPDDDCLYYEDTLELTKSFFQNNADVDIVIGSIYDRENHLYLFKKWPVKRKKVNFFNVYFLSSSITIFVRKPNSQLFDEHLGAGALYGSCEDPDYLYCALKKGKKIVYEPSIQVWHPAPVYQKMSLEKVSSYAKGFGYFVRKDVDLFKIILLILLITKKLLQFVFQSNKFQRGYFMAFYTGLFNGLLGKKHE